MKFLKIIFIFRLTLDGSVIINITLMKRGIVMKKQAKLKRSSKEFSVDIVTDNKFNTINNLNKESY